jgi:hypothetical protein
VVRPPLGVLQAVPPRAGSHVLASPEAQNSQVTRWGLRSNRIPGAEATVNRFKSRLGATETRLKSTDEDPCCL